MSKEQEAEHARLVHAQAQAERVAGQLLTQVCHQASAGERARLLSLAFWHAGYAGALDDLARQVGERESANARGPRR